jgi:hypothetical protein
VLFLVILSVAFARPIVSPPRRTSQIILFDQSAVGDSTLAGQAGPADLVIPFQGSLSAALVSALRAAPALAGRGDSIGLTIVSPFVLDDFDEATFRLRQQWTGNISLVEIPPARETAGTIPVLAADDPLAASIALAAPPEGFDSRLVRARPAPEDSAWAAGGGSLVLWPRLPQSLDWTPGPKDSIGGIFSGDIAVVAAFSRDYSPPEGQRFAVWADGSPAASTIRWGRGCIRNVAVSVPENGDLVLRPGFLALTRVLLAGCDGPGRSVRASDSLLEQLRGPSNLLPAIRLERAGQRRRPADPWILMAAALVFAVEPLARRRKAG